MNIKLYKALSYPLVVLVVLTMSSGVIFARKSNDKQNVINGSSGFLMPDTVLFENFDGIAPGELPAGWDTVDLTSIPQDPHWHIDTYQAHGGSGYSWWCGDTNPGWATPPGYGNYWYQWLTLDYDLTGAPAGMNLIFDHRYDAEFVGPEPPFDTWDGMNVQISTDGGTTWEVITPLSGYPYNAVYAFNLHDLDTLPGFSGPIQNWNTDTVDLTPYINTVGKIRFSFCADLYTSDEDGGYNSDGAWFIDNVLIVSAAGDTNFFDDVESGQLPEWTSEGGVDKIAPGNYWAVIDTISQNDGRPCSYSGPNAAYCGDSLSGAGDGTYRVAEHYGKGLQNTLNFPPLDLSAATSATLSFMKRAKGDGSGGYTYIDASTDGGTNWVQLDLQNEQPSGGNWLPHILNIYDQCGEPDVRFRIRAQTGTGAAHYLYLYVDDICVTTSGTEVVLQNDDGDAYWYWGDMLPGEMGAAKLTPTFYPCKIKRAMIDFYAPSGAGTGTYVLHIYKDQGGLPGTELLVPPDTFDVVVTSFQKFEIRDVSAADIKLVANELFWVAAEQVAPEDSAVRLLSDFEPTPGVNAIYTGGSWQLGYVGGDFMMRAVIDTTSDAVEEFGSGEISSYTFYQSTSNPTRNRTVIEYTIPTSQKVSLNVYDVTGQLVKSLINAKVDAGTHQITWNGRDDRGNLVASGVYFMKFVADDYTATKKSLIVR